MHTTVFSKFFQLTVNDKNSKSFEITFNWTMKEIGAKLPYQSRLCSSCNSLKFEQILYDPDETITKTPYHHLVFVIILATYPWDFVALLIAD